MFCGKVQAALSCCGLKWLIVRQVFADNLVSSCFSVALPVGCGQELTYIVTTSGFLGRLY